MRSSLPAFGLVATLLLATAPAAGLEAGEGAELARNGALSRHQWRPDFASTRVGAWQLSAGLAIGLRGAVRTQLDRSIAPALSVQLKERASLSLLPASGGAMLILQLRP